ncbi:MAG: DUF5752 family protein [Methylococcaceae bacterium]|nr:DUF5752 family protein [Methylococcaceae bacterium]
MIINATKLTEPSGTHDMPEFILKDCALIAIATRHRANTLKEFRDHILSLSQDSLYYHFWGNLLLPRFEEREYNNDFASWIKHSLHDAKLAEQLAVVDPIVFSDMEELRQHLLEYIDDRLEQSEYLQWLQSAQPFEFIRSQIVVFNTHINITQPSEMLVHIPNMSVSSIFYHFIDARRRTEHNIDDFRHWLACFGATYQALIEQLSYIDPYFSSLTELRQQIQATFQQYFAEETP